MKTRTWLLSCLLFLIAGLPAATPAQPQEKDARLGRVTVAGISVRGLTPHEARLRLAKALRPKLEQQVTLTDGARTLMRRRRELGVGLDVAGMVARAKSGPSSVPVRFSVDREALQRSLRRVAQRVVELTEMMMIAMVPAVAGRSAHLKFAVGMLGPGIEEARHVVEQVVAQVQGLMPDSLELAASVVSVDPDQPVEQLLEF